MKTKLYIDDIRIPDANDNFVVVRSYDEAIYWMRTNGCPDYISFDHDLGFTPRKHDNAIENSGYEVAKWMVENDLNAKSKFIPEHFEFTVHSANPVGAANIVGLLQSYMRKREKYGGDK